MPYSKRKRAGFPIEQLVAAGIAFFFYSVMFSHAQMPFINAGSDSSFARLDLAQTYLDTMNRDSKTREEQQKHNKELVDSGLVSALDLAAPNDAINEFNGANTLLKAQKSKEAMKPLRKAILDYPNFVSAHVALGVACVDQGDNICARSEFETAAKLDDKFALAFLRLGQLWLSQNDFGAAQAALGKAVSLSPNDLAALSRLVYAQHGAHDYRRALETARRIHGFDHQGFASVHYVAASSALALKDFETMEGELNFFLEEDPNNAFAPIARQNVAANKGVVLHSQTFPNTERLQAELNALGDETDGESCEDCDTAAELRTPVIGNESALLSDAQIVSGTFLSGWTIRKNVDQVTVFFSASRHGHMVNNLSPSDIQILDDNKPPEDIFLFVPQSKLPLRLALLIDTSGSVHDRFSFEKSAAAKFIEKMLNSTSDLAFEVGFSQETHLAQDFSSNAAELGKGIQSLSNGGGTALFDAVSYACWKLAGYPDRERVARVLVIMSDGEDNSSHSTLKQSIQIAERTGVTIYTVSTKEIRSGKTDADKVLEELAGRTGGEAMFPADIQSLAGSFDKLRDLIRSRYFIAYKPADFKSNGSYRTISITAKKDGQSIRIQARKGYHAQPSQSHY